MRVLLLLIALLGAKAVCAEKLDVAFIIDGSDSVGVDNWDSVRQFYADVADGWTIGPDDTKVALATFGDEAKLIWDLDGHPVKSDLLDTISQVPYPGGELHVQGLVSLIIAEIFGDTAGDRLDACKTFVLFTDGAPYIDPKAAASGSTALQAKGITSYVVCMTPGCNETFASSLASPQKEKGKTYFLVNDYDSLKDLVDELLVQINANTGRQRFFPFVYPKRRRRSAERISLDAERPRRSAEIDPHDDPYDRFGHLPFAYAERRRRSAERFRLDEEGPSTWLDAERPRRSAERISLDEESPSWLDAERPRRSAELPFQFIPSAYAERPRRSAERPRRSAEILPSFFPWAYTERTRRSAERPRRSAEILPSFFPWAYTERTRRSAERPRIDEERPGALDEERPRRSAERPRRSA